MIVRMRSGSQDTKPLLSIIEEKFYEDRQESIKDEFWRG